MFIIFSILLSLLSINGNALSYVPPYGAKVISLAEGGRSFLKGYDAVMVNPAGAYFVDESEMGEGINFGYTYASTSIMFAGEDGFQAGFAVKDIDKGFGIDSMQMYVGYSFEVSKWWIMGANVGYNFVSTHPGWDANVGISFGPGLQTANRSGIVGSVTLRNPLENAGVGEIAASIGYTYRNSFNICIDNIYVFEDILRPVNLDNTYPDAYDLVFAIETYPLEDDDFSMTFSGRINGVGDYNQLQVGMGIGYVFSRTSRFNFGALATEFSKGRIDRVTFGFSFIQGV